MSAYGSYRFGQDSPSRIAGTTELFLESGEVPPEMTYQPVIPFYPPTLTTGGGAGAQVLSQGNDEWKSYPGRLDLFCYLGDDVQIPLFFQDPSDWEMDMAGPEWTWEAQVRVYRSYRSTLVNDFVVAATYLPPDQTEEQPQGQTQVTLFLPRSLNVYSGEFAWDVRSTGPFQGPDFGAEVPEGVPEEEWPPTTSMKTWLYGDFTVVPRTSDTPYLPPTRALDASAMQPITVNGYGYMIGPNGRVP